MGNAVRFRKPTRRKNPFKAVFITILILLILSVAGYFGYGFVSQIFSWSDDNDRDEIIIILDEYDSEESKFLPDDDKEVAEEEITEEDVTEDEPTEEQTTVVQEPEKNTQTDTITEDDTTTTPDVVNNDIQG